MAERGTRPHGAAPPGSSSVVASTTTLLRRGFVLAAFLVVAGLAAVVIAVILAAGAGEGDVELRLGDDVFTADAESLAGTIERQGPTLFSDVSGAGARDVYIQHLGDDPRTGWSAFAARPEGASRDCTLVWEPDAERFLSPCDGTAFPADGAGLRQYPATVDDDGDVVVDLREPAPAP